MAYITFYNFPSTISFLCYDASLLTVQLCGRLQKKRCVVHIWHHSPRKALSSEVESFHLRFQV